ncbi:MULTISPECIES: hypothetical protein [Sphingobacterium]|uniref:hypothetical protein n=1 Tax=Sphingobacterium TaxID=28453 RepID=UPI0013DB53B2|nr:MULTISPECIES: hypothetical protein [unclassified Sphingobacterium]
MYIPFEQVTVKLFHELVARGYKHYVLQRFSWPSVAKGTGFLLSAYENLEDADRHAAQLDAKEGKALHLPDGAVKIADLLEVNSGYRLFLNKFKDENWNTRMLKWYEKNIINYLRIKTRFRSKDPIDILFTLESGRVWATISSGDKKLKVPAIDLIQ